VLEAHPYGLLLHENLVFLLIPPHAGMRQYWRYFAPSSVGQGPCHTGKWWQQFLRDKDGTSFWHETYFRGGQIESVYLDMPGTGLAKFAPVTPALARRFRPAAWACEWEANRRQAFRKKSYIGAEEWMLSTRSSSGWQRSRSAMPRASPIAAPAPSSSPVRSR
jgi:Domain of unknown function (DUF4188)